MEGEMQEGEAQSVDLRGGWIDVELTAGDCQQFNAAVWGTTRRQVAVMVPWIAVAATVGFTLGTHPEPWVFALLAVGLASLLPRMRTRQRVARDAVAHAVRYGTGRIRTTQSGLEFESRSRRVWQSWRSVREVRETHDVVLVMMSQSSAWIVPKRSFLSEADWKAFMAQVRGWIDDDGPLEVLEPES